MIKIAVCDDDGETLETARNLILKWSKERNIPVEVTAYDNGDSLIFANSRGKIDIIFLDIIMPLLNGMETAKEIRTADTAVKIVFLTSSPEFALESYEVKAYDYLLKPVSYDRVSKVLDECTAAFEGERKNIVLKTAFGYQKIYLSDVEYVEAQNKKVIFYLKNGEPTESPAPLYSIEDKLTSENGFFKCHRSYLVYMPAVESFSSSDIIFSSGRKIPIARRYAKAFKEAYFELMFSKRGKNVWQ